MPHNTTGRRTQQLIISGYCRGCWRSCVPGGMMVKGALPSPQACLMSWVDASVAAMSCVYGFDTCCVYVQ